VTRFKYALWLFVYRIATSVTDKAFVECDWIYDQTRSARFTTHNPTYYGTGPTR
jgi:hypothetical protein